MPGIIGECTSHHQVRVAKANQGGQLILRTIYRAQMIMNKNNHSKLINYNSKKKDEDGWSLIRLTITSKNVVTFLKITVTFLGSLKVISISQRAQQLITLVINKNCP